MPILPSVALLLPFLAPFHVPHDDARDVLAFTNPSGQLELVAVSSQTLRVIHSLDGGLSWNTLAGEAVERQQSQRLALWPESSGAMVLIGTDRGVWTYDPASGAVLAANLGLPSPPPAIAGIASAATPGSPALLVTNQGDVYLRSDRGQPWVLALQTGTPDDHACVAMVPAYDPMAPSGPARSLVAGIAGRFHFSRDGGSTWSIHSAFATAAMGPQDWHISALAFSRSYLANGGLLLARSREDPASPSGHSGEVWTSHDFGASFSLTFQAPSAVRALAATPVGPGGNSHFLLALQIHPDLLFPQSWLGVFRSDDGGSTWDDFGNYQDFFPEEPTGDTVPSRWRSFLGLAVSPTYADDGLLWLARPEGLYRSRDEGWSWRQLPLRSERQIRDLEAAIDPNGQLLALGATYGGGLLIQDPAKGSSILFDRGPIAYPDTLSVSPSFARDGTVAYCGSTGVAMWYHPAIPPANPFSTVGWLAPATNDFGYVRTIQISPHYDGSGGMPQSDRAIFFSSDPEGVRLPRTMRTLDGGLSLEDISTQTGGSPLPHLLDIAVAPTFDASTPGGRTDVYGITHSALYRLDDTVWTQVLVQPGASFVDLEIDPAFSRPGNPRLYIASAIGPRVLLVDDQAGGPLLTTVFAPGLENLLLRKLAASPDPSQPGVLYCSTWSQGVFRLDLAATSPVWNPVGGPFPSAAAGPIALSPDFANDRTIFVGTLDGIVQGQDLPNTSWRLLDAPLTVDDEAPELSWFSPSAPANPQPLRTWEWPRISQAKLRASLGGELRCLNGSAALARQDQDYVEWEALGRSFQVRTFRGPTMGTILVEAIGLVDGHVLRSKQIPLNAATAAETLVQIRLDTTRQVIVRATAILAPNQRLAIDSFAATRN